MAGARDRICRPGRDRLLGAGLLGPAGRTLWDAGILGGQFGFQGIHELAQQLLRHLLQHSAPELSKLADDLQVGVDADIRATPVLVQLGGDRGGRVAGPARLLALAVDNRAVLVAVLLDETHLAAEFTGDGPDLDFDFAEVFVAFMADQRRTGHQRNHLLQVAQHVPGLLDRRADGELVGDLHSVVPLMCGCIR